MKICRICLTEKSLDSFNRCAQNADRLKHHCRECQKELMAKWRESHADEVKAYRRDYYVAEKSAAPEKLAKRRARYYEKNKDRIKAANRFRAAKDPKKAVDRMRRWASLNPDRYRALQSAYQKRNKGAILERNKLRQRKELADVAPSHAKRLLSRVGAGIAPLSFKDIPAALVETKQISLRIKRFLKEKQHGPS